jgi:AraC-like DNA-binding protein
MIIDETSVIRLTSVVDLSWDSGNDYVKGRPYAALSLRIKGDSLIRSATKEERLSDGDIAYVPKDMDYRKRSGKEHLIVIHFDTDDSADKELLVFKPKRTPLFESLFSSLYEIWQAKLPGYYFSALSVFYRILYELRQEDEKNSEDYNKIKPACDYIHIHYDDPELNVPALAGKCFMSDTYFRKLFLKVYGTTPLSYINYLRMEKAKVLLSEFNTTVDYVALKSGFTDVKYFSTVFKKFVGVPPSKYR